MIRTWQITPRGTKEVHFPGASSLDAVTRQLPEGYYTTFRTYDSCTRVIGLTAHLCRLPNADASLLRRRLYRLLEPYRPAEARVRLMETKQGRVYISIEPLKLPPPAAYEKGVRAETVTLQRTNPREKSTSFIGASDEERKKIAKLGIFEALLVKNGRILEGMTSNFFYVLDGVLYTARRGILLGVTRTMVIRAARGAGVQVRYMPLKLDQLPAVKEAFITSSSRGIVPVIQIDEVRVGEGRVGELTKQVSAAYEAYVRQRAERIFPV
ncbi:MAG: hypothetical protein OHK0041_23130 [Anaerolineales bacterium]